MKTIPNEIKIALVDAILKKDFNSSYVYGGSYPLSFDELLNSAIKNLSKRKKKNIINKEINYILVPNEYWSLQRSGMFWEFFPEMTGILDNDKKEFTKFYIERGREWIDFILNNEK